MSGIRIEPERHDADLERGVEIWNAVHPRDRISAADARSYAGACRDFQAFLAFEDGDALAGAYAAVEGTSPSPRAAIYVLREARGRGLGTALHRTVSDWSRERGASDLVITVDEDDADSLAWVQRRGFTEFSRDSMLELELGAVDEPRVEPPAGVEIVTWAERPELARGLYEVAREAFADIPGTQDEEIEPFEEWLHAHMQGEGDKPEATFVAVADGAVVGYAKFILTTAQPELAWHDLTGVKRAWRGRGVARSLKAAQITWAKRQGYERLRTNNEERNEPIRRLNKSFGYHPTPGRIRLRGPLAPAS